MVVIISWNYVLGELVAMGGNSAVSFRRDGERCWSHGIATKLQINIVSNKIKNVFEDMFCPKISFLIYFITSLQPFLRPFRIILFYNLTEVISFM